MKNSLSLIAALFLLHGLVAAATSEKPPDSKILHGVDKKWHNSELEPLLIADLKYAEVEELQDDVQTTPSNQGSKPARIQHTDVDTVIRKWSSPGEEVQATTSSSDRLRAAPPRPAGKAHSKSHDCDQLPLPKSQIDEIMDYDWLKGGLIGLACIHLAVQLYLLPVFIKERNNVFMRHRSPLLTALGCICGMFVSVLSCAGYNMLSVPQYQTVMKLYVMLQNFFFPALIVPVCLRAWRVVALHKLNQDKSQAAALMPLELDKTKSGFGSVYEAEILMISRRKEVSEIRYIQLAVWAMALILLYSLMWYFLGVGDCIAADIQTYNSLAVGAIALACMVGCTLRVRRTVEAFKIKREVYVGCLLHLILGSAVLVSFAFVRLPKLMDGKHQIAAFAAYHYILITWLLLSVVFTVSLPLILWRNVERYKQRLVNMEKDFRMRFKDRAHREVFFRYLELELSSELYLFWEEIEAFRSLPKGGGQREAARIIYNKFIRDGAMLEVGLDYDLQLESSWNLHSTISADMYDVAQDAIYVKMLRAYPRYLHFIALNPDVLAEPLSQNSDSSLAGLEGLQSSTHSTEDIGLSVQAEQPTDPNLESTDPVSTAPSSSS